MAHWGSAAGLGSAFAAGMAQAGISNMGGRLTITSSSNFGSPVGIPPQSWETTSKPDPLADIAKITQISEKTLNGTYKGLGWNSPTEPTFYGDIWK